MTLKEARAAVDALKDFAVGGDFYDAERAHCKEDALHVAALKAIASGKCRYARRLAATVLLSLKFDFRRDCS